jgi:lipopolysaccharide biosynthesis glycosyltransferase
MYKENKIPIVLASDNNYIPQMYVTIVSALENKNQETFYDFYLLISKKLNTKNEKYFYNLEKHYQNCKINFIVMYNSFNDVKMTISHIKKPTYYRLKMSELLPDNYEKAIYLDVDIIVLKDLQEFFNTDLTDSYIGGVKAAGYILEKTLDEYYKKVGLRDKSKYINAGVTIWNLKKIRESNLLNELYDSASRNYCSMDQDVINIVFQNNIKILDFKFNVMTKYKKKYLKNKKGYEQLISIYSKEQLEEGINNPVIIHYADKIKPWFDTKGWFADEWWKYAKTTPYINYFKINFIINILKSILSKFLSIEKKFNNSNQTEHVIIKILGIKISLKLK